MLSDDDVAGCNAVSSCADGGAIWSEDVVVLMMTRKNLLITNYFPNTTQSEIDATKFHKKVAVS
jgi:hypothetical protein